MKLFGILLWNAWDQVDHALLAEVSPLIRLHLRVDYQDERTKHLT